MWLKLNPPVQSKQVQGRWMDCARSGTWKVAWGCQRRQAFEKHRSPQSLAPEMRQLIMFFPESLLLPLWSILPFGNQLCSKELCNYVHVLLRPYKTKPHLINRETTNSGGDGHRFSLPWAGQSIMDKSVKPNWDSHCHLYECQITYICFSLWNFSPLILKSLF